MSELNNSKSNKIVIWFLIIFTVLAIIITAVLIYLTNNSQIFENKNNNKQENTQINSENITDEPNLAVKLTDTYHNNPIEFTMYYYFDGITKTEEKYYQDGDDKNEHQKIGDYVQITGLKNKNIENKINSEIVQKMKKLLEKYNYVHTMVSANYANVISIYITSEQLENYTDELTLNYRLDTGEQIQFEDLFTNKQYIKTILTQAAYIQYMRQYDKYEKLQNIDYSKIETSTFEIVNNYLNGAKINFYFSHNRIVVIIGKDIVVINMPKFCENIAIYKRYLSTQNLYENNKSNIELFVYSERNFDNAFLARLEELEENLYVDIGLYDNSENKSEEKQNKSLENMKQILEQVKNLALQNQDKAYIFYYQDRIFDEAFEDDMHPESAYICVMDKEYYKKQGKEIIAKGNREYLEYEGVVSYQDDNILKYIYENGSFILE